MYIKWYPLKLLALTLSLPEWLIHLEVLKLHNCNFVLVWSPRPALGSSLHMTNKYLTWIGYCLRRGPYTSCKQVQRRKLQATSLDFILKYPKYVVLSQVHRDSLYSFKIMTTHYVIRGRYFVHKSRYNALSLAIFLHQQWRYNPAQFHNFTNDFHSNTQHLSSSAGEWGLNYFEIYGSSFEHSSISSCTRTSYVSLAVFISKVNRWICDAI